MMYLLLEISINDNTTLDMTGLINKDKATEYTLNLDAYTSIDM